MLIQTSRNAAMQIALAVLACYAPHYAKTYERLGKTEITRDGLEWAWNEYCDTTKHVSLRSLAKALRCRRGTLQDMFRKHYGFEYARMSARRGSCGDLFHTWSCVHHPKMTY